jgi:hypothetical protein
MQPTIPTPLAWGFMLLPWATWALMAWLLGKASRRALIVAWVGMAYMVVTGSLAAAGVFSHFDALPPPLLIAAMAQFALLVYGIFFWLKPADIASLSQPALIALQVFRIPTELLMAGLAAQQLLPTEMTFHGRNFDIVSGVAGLLAGLWLWRRGKAGSNGRNGTHGNNSGKSDRTLALFYNALGLVLVTVVVVHGMLSVPTPLQRLHLSIDNIHIARFPICWLPFGLVPAAYALHFLSLRLLFMKKRDEWQS